MYSGVGVYGDDEFPGPGRRRKEKKVGVYIPCQLLQILQPVDVVQFVFLIHSQVAQVYASIVIPIRVNCNLCDLWWIYHGVG